MPLALDQAGAYIKEAPCPLSDYLTRYQDSRSDILHVRGSFNQDYPTSVATTWSLSFEKVRQANTAAEELLHFCAFLAPDAIPEEILVSGASYLGDVLAPVVTNPPQFDQVCKELLRFSLLQRGGDEHTLTVHRLVQAILQDTMTKQESKRWAGRVTQAINTTMRTTEKKPSSRPATFREWSDYRERYLPHLEACAMWIKHGYVEKTDEAAELFDAFAYHLSFYFSCYSPDEIIETLKNAINLWEKAPGANNSHIVDCLYLLIEPYRFLGRYREAKEAEERAKDIMEGVNPEVLSIVRISGLTPRKQVFDQLLQDLKEA